MHRVLLGRTERRVVAAILITATISLVAAILMGRSIIARISATAFHPEFGTALDQSLGVYADLAKALKQSMRYEAEAIAASSTLRASAARGDRAELQAELERHFIAHPSLVSLAVEVDVDTPPIAKKERTAPVDEATERTLTVRRALGDTGADDQPGPALVAVFATPSARFNEMESAQSFAQAYRQIERDHREVYLDATYRSAFALLLGLTVALAVIAGVLVVRPVTRRIAHLAAAMRPVAEGDLSVRVADLGGDEVADLGRAFNHMLEELEQSRARLEFLRRMSEWQKVARRLAHEIKNPLTPIQLAVEECHRRYQGDDPGYKRIVQTTLEVVEEEVGSLRRLVTQFSSFARLPQPELAPTDLGEFLREQRDHFTAPDPTEGSGRPPTPDGDDALVRQIKLSFDIPGEAMPTEIDREMLHRGLANLIRNAAQAIRDAREGPRRGPASGDAARPPWRGKGEVLVTARSDDTFYTIDIDDDGPGIDPDVREAMFNPYVTTKRDGTGLGLSIVKKIIVDHGGTIDARDAPLGGARLHIRLPRAGTAAALAAKESLARAAEGPPSSRRPAPMAPTPPLR
jgi:two-component system, NtrC family, nitrogen regulation sensor histidine kinase NtrY